MVYWPWSILGFYKMSLTDEFLNKYDDGSLRFDKIKYRSGAVITGHFDLEDGFRVENGKLVWGYVRIHTGVDRADGRKYQGVKDAVVAPFDFDRSRFEDYNGKVYGTLAILESHKYGFEFRTAHMRPEQIKILDKLKNHEPIERNTLVGQAGNYGLSAGAHTHTEIKSFSKTAPVLENILKKKFGDMIKKPYTNTEILSFYKKREHFKNATDEDILHDWAAQRKKRMLFFANRFLYRYKDFDGKLKTRYSTELLFNGL